MPIGTLTFNPARNDLARVFLFPDGIYKCNTPGEFASCVSVDALTQDRGDITKIECPSPYQYGEFIEIGNFPGELSRLTTTLTGRMSRFEVSTFYKLFIEDCAFDAHLHFGLCQRPDSFNEFDKIMVFEDVRVTNFTTDPLVALQSGDRAVINESVSISVGRYYEIVNLAYSERAGTITGDNSSIIAVDICDRRSCGTCDVDSDGCQLMFAIDDTDNFFFSNDGGVVWDELQIVDGLAANPTALVDMVCWQNYVLILDDDDEFWFIDRTDVVNGTATVFEHLDPLLTFAASAMATTQQGSVGVIVGAGGNIALVEDIEGGITLVDAGFATAEDLNDVYIGMDGTVVAVGNAGAVVFSYDGESYFTAQTAPTAQNLTAVLVKNRRNWLVGAVNGEVWCTDNAGITWSRVAYPTYLTSTDAIEEFDMASPHVLYFVAGESLYRSLDGGNSWIAEPNGSSSMVTNDGLAAVAACVDNVNFVLAGGTVIDGEANTGIIITGIETGGSV